MADIDSSRTVPYDLSAERATLGAILLDRDAILAVASWLVADDFYLEKHAQIYDAMMACFQRREPADLLTVAAELRRRGQLEHIGGVAMLSELVMEVPTAVHIEYYARTVERTAILRRLIEAGGRIAALGYHEGRPIDEILDRAEQTLAAVTQRREHRSLVPIRQVVSTLFAQIETMQEHRGEVTGIPSGYHDLDSLTGGFHPSDLSIIAARPSVGKTSFALSIAYHVARSATSPVVIFSLEMSREQVVQRLLSMHTGIDMQRLRTGQLHGEALATVVEGLGVLSDLPIYIEDTPGLSITDVRIRARRLHHEVGISLMVIDYLQLLSGRRTENRVQEVSDISRGLKELARELNVPVIALSQLSRAVDTRSNRVPLLSDLRESGSIEQDADLVMFIYREELYDSATDKKGIAEVHLAKHRHGPIGVVYLRFDAPTTRFLNLERYRPDVRSASIGDDPATASIRTHLGRLPTEVRPTVSSHRVSTLSPPSLPHRSP